MISYMVVLNLGTHHYEVTVSDKDFYRWLDDLRSEFEFCFAYISPDDSHLLKKYYILNYWGDMQHVGSVFIVGSPSDIVSYKMDGNHGKL